jgi:5-methylcytosine-specific restriction endonuclease McrA
MTDDHTRRDRPVAPASPSRRGRNKRSAAKEGSTPRRSRRRSSAYADGGSQQLTSTPTHRAAYSDTRQWLLERHGAICAYCAQRTDVGEITLDHVTPRRGLTAYDRRDNLVLCCKRCNGGKADKPILAFLLADRKRAATLLRYGTHLSPMLLDLARQIAGPEAAALAERLADPDYPYSD